MVGEFLGCLFGLKFWPPQLLVDCQPSWPLMCLLGSTGHSTSGMTMKGKTSKMHHSGFEVVSGLGANRPHDHSGFEVVRYVVALGSYA